MSRALAFIQARMSSSRFPGKVLEPLQGQSMIVYMARRAARSARLDGVVVVTSDDPSDDALADATEAAGIATFRGDLNNVLKRYADAAEVFSTEEVVRLTGDCPLIDAAIIDAVVDARRSTSADYASNVDPPTYPDGFDTECFTRGALDRAHRQAQQRDEREHVTVWMRSENAGLRRVNVGLPFDLSHLRLTVDYPDDLDVVRRIVAELSNESFDLFDILRLVSAQPDILNLNLHARNERLANSLPEVSDTIARNYLLRSSSGVSR